uniref:Protein FAR1-RELATED SEQUENCE n=1 Tax=Kalanchoe fedtschenkoi TaxID=63787 RepID=A0A7N0RD96_KALFE
MKSIKNQEIKFFEAKTSELIGLVVESDEAAYALYNDYAQRIEFSIRRRKQRYHVGDEDSLTMREFVCSKKRNKIAEKESNRSYSRNITRSDVRLYGSYWRDGIMKKDYDFFGDLLIHDTTYRTNKYDTICGPFVGMNHYTNNVMFGCGYIINKRRSETTNKSVSRRFIKLCGLCDFYYTFCDVVSEWRSNKMKFNYSNLNGIPEIVVSNSNLLRHVRDVYTRNMYKIFEDRFWDGISCTQIITLCTLFAETFLVDCTCKCFTQDDLLCMHSLRVLNFNCVQRIPDAYILKRWRKDVRKGCAESEESLCTNSSSESSFWRVDMVHKFSSLISYCMYYDNIEIRNSAGSRVVGDRNIKKKHKRKEN